MIIINFKAYKTGPDALRLAKICEVAAKKTRLNIILAVQTADINLIASSVDLPIIAQHTDSINFGAHTGFILSESIKHAGAIGSLVNHSERQLSVSEIKATIKRLKSLGLISILCVNTIEQIKSFKKFNPDIFAFEPTKLIGGLISVSSANPKLVSAAVDATRIPVLCGAGIHSAGDVKGAIALGARGVLVASGVDNSKHPLSVILELASAFRVK